MHNDIDRLYGLIERLKRICCKRLEVDDWPDLTLARCHGGQPYWKQCQRGIYLFFDPNEKRSDGVTHRVVRVGTHAIKSNRGNTTLWGRLKQHKGTDMGGGNHGGSIFRHVVGNALGNRDGNLPPSWELEKFTSEEEKAAEAQHEIRVSAYIKGLPFLIIKIDPDPDPDNHRKYLETNLIALLSNINRISAVPPYADEPSAAWLGRFAANQKIGKSGMWNSRDVDVLYDPKFFDLLEWYVEQT